MPNSPVEIKAGQVWEKGKTRRIVLINDGVMIAWSSSKSRLRAYSWLHTFQRWAATAKLVKEGDNGR